MNILRTVPGSHQSAIRRETVEELSDLLVDYTTFRRGCRRSVLARLLKLPCNARGRSDCGKEPLVPIPTQSLPQVASSNAATEVQSDVDMAADTGRTAHKDVETSSQFTADSNSNLSSKQFSGSEVLSLKGPSNPFATLPNAILVCLVEFLRSEFPWPHLRNPGFSDAVAPLTDAAGTPYLDLLFSQDSEGDAAPASPQNIPGTASFGLHVPNVDIPGQHDRSLSMQSNPATARMFPPAMQDRLFHAEPQSVTDQNQGSIDTMGAFETSPFATTNLIGSRNLGRFDQNSGANTGFVRRKSALHRRDTMSRNLLESRLKLEHWELRRSFWLRTTRAWLLHFIQEAQPRVKESAAGPDLRQQLELDVPGGCSKPIAKQYMANFLEKSHYPIPEKLQTGTVSATGASSMASAGSSSTAGQLMGSSTSGAGLVSPEYVAEAFNSDLARLLNHLAQELRAQNCNLTEIGWCEKPLRAAAGQAGADKAERKLRSEQSRRSAVGSTSPSSVHATPIALGANGGQTHSHISRAVNQAQSQPAAVSLGNEGGSASAQTSEFSLVVHSSDDGVGRGNSVAELNGVQENEREGAVNFNDTPSEQGRSASSSVDVSNNPMGIRTRSKSNSGDTSFGSPDSANQAQLHFSAPGSVKNLESLTVEFQDLHL